MPSKAKSKSKSKKSKSAVAAKTAGAGADAPAKEAEQDRDMTHAYAEDLKTDIYTDVNANPKALVHSTEWRKIMNGARFVASTLDGRNEDCTLLEIELAFVFEQTTDGTGRRAQATRWRSIHPSVLV